MNTTNVKWGKFLTPMLEIKRLFLNGGSDKSRCRGGEERVPPMRSAPGRCRRSSRLEASGHTGCVLTSCVPTAPGHRLWRHLRIRLQWQLLCDALAAAGWGSPCPSHSHLIPTSPVVSAPHVHLGLHLQQGRGRGALPAAHWTCCPLGCLPWVTFVLKPNKRSKPEGFWIWSDKN